MRLGLPSGETITVTRITEDNFGNRTPGESFEIDGVAAWPTSSKETMTGSADLVASGFTILVPSDSIIFATDQVTLRGVVYNVAGDPMLYRSPFTARKALEVQLTATTG